MRPCVCQVNEYFVQEFLPLCRQLVTSQLLPDHGDGLANWPDPARPLEEHSVGARTVAFAFIRRQQLLRVIRHTLENDSERLLRYLHSPEAL